MRKRTILVIVSAMLGHLALAEATVPDHPELTLVEGPFHGDWESLTKYQCSDWFGDAKFGIWAHWGPQCQPEQGDWFARSLYMQGSSDYKYPVEHYGHPSKAGFQEVVHEWKAANLNAEKLLAF